MSPKEAIAFVKRHGIVLESARGPVPALRKPSQGNPFAGVGGRIPKGKRFFA
jgi:hypothetical protein